MCLLRPNDRLNNCDHEECKHVQVTNKTTCLHSLNQSQKINNTPIISNLAQLLQNRSLSGFQPQQSPNLSGIQCIQQYNISKNIITCPPNEDLNNEDSFMLNKKKIKLDNNNNISDQNRQINQNKDFQPNTILINPNYQQFATNSNSEDNKLQFNTPTLNNILLTNTQNQTETKPNNFQLMHANQPIYMPYIQNIQQIPDNNNNIQHDVQFIPYQQQNFQSSFQNFPLNIQAKSDLISNFSPQNNNANDNMLANKENSALKLEDILKEIQNKFFELFCNQNKMLNDLREKSDLIQDTIACLINEVTALKQIVKHGNPEKQFSDLQKSILSNQIPENSRETATSDNLIKMLYGPQHEFQYQLVFKNELTLPLYRERNFKFTVLLTDKDGNIIKNSNRIPLTLAIYTSENPPKFIDVNTSGNKVLKGMIDKDMVDGAVMFEKIQIKEVTSHFRNGWVFFVVYPKVTGVMLNNYVGGVNGVMINAAHIKPLVLEKVIVKAKRTKEKDEKEMVAKFQDNQSSDMEQ